MDLAIQIALIKSLMKLVGFGIADRHETQDPSFELQISRLKAFHELLNGLSATFFVSMNGCRDEEMSAWLF